MPQTAIKLIVGLGNPGSEYEQTRHNAGFWFIDKIISLKNLSLKPEKKFSALVGSYSENNQIVYILMPQKYMNLSGQSVQSFCQFYKINPNEILVAHDELDLPVGCVRLKDAGGSGGHNGLKDIINKLGTQSFYRLRIGIGHPRDVNNQQQVHDYVLNRPNVSDKAKILDAIDDAYAHLSTILSGDLQKAMKNLHT